MNLLLRAYTRSASSGESLCEWQHDSDHDTDFERHSGYNNKTISIHTGPQADHTTGVPLQGHYMVMYTNSEVSSKRARLLSPLYNFPTAQQLCFRFYYFMHGTGVGTLRAYVKPESIEMQNVLVDDMEIEAKSEFIIFQIHGMYACVHADTLDSSKERSVREDD